MPAPYSQDLRDRVGAAVAGGQSARAAAEHFAVSVSTAIRWAQRLRDEGHTQARAMGGDQRSRLKEHREAVLTLLGHEPDLTLREIRAALIERHALTVGLGTVSRFLAAHNITLKKKPARRRTDAARRGRSPAAVHPPSAGADAGAPGFPR
jgi:transposase